MGAAVTHADMVSDTEDCAGLSFRYFPQQRPEQLSPNKVWQQQAQHEQQPLSLDISSVALRDKFPADPEVGKLFAKGAESVLPVLRALAQKLDLGPAALGEADHE